MIGRPLSSAMLVIWLPSICEYWGFEYRKMLVLSFDDESGPKCNFSILATPARWGNSHLLLYRLVEPDVILQAAAGAFKWTLRCPRVPLQISSSGGISALRLHDVENSRLPFRREAWLMNNTILWDTDKFQSTQWNPVTSPVLQSDKVLRVLKVGHPVARDELLFVEWLTLS